MRESCKRTMPSLSAAVLVMVALLAREVNTQGNTMNVTHIQHWDDENTVLYAIADRLCFNRCPYHPNMPASCSKGFYESRFRSGCYHCHPNCPRCDDRLRDDWMTCALIAMSRIYCRTAEYAHRWFRVRECKRCHSSCKECDGPGENDCKTCHANQYAINGQCKPITYTFGHRRPDSCWRIQNGCDALRNISHRVLPNVAPPCPNGTSTVKYSPFTCTQCHLGHCHHCSNWAECAYREAQVNYYCQNDQFLPFSARMCAAPSNACDSSPCGNGANCTNVFTYRGYECECEEPFTGPQCLDIELPNQQAANSTNTTTTTSQGTRRTTSGINTTTPPDLNPSERTTLPQWTMTSAGPSSSTTPKPPQEKASDDFGDGPKIALIVCLTLAILIIVILAVILVLHYKRTPRKSTQPVDMQTIVEHEETNSSTA